MGNMRNLNLFVNHKGFNTLKMFSTLQSIMASLNVFIVMLLKPASPYYTKPLFLTLTRALLFKQLHILLIICPHFF